jgi:dolichyl-phosphate-mannose-protein mannosyltransferase
MWAVLYDDGMSLTTASERIARSLAEAERQRGRRVTVRRLDDAETRPRGAEKPARPPGRAHGDGPVRRRGTGKPSVPGPSRAVGGADSVPEPEPIRPAERFARPKPVSEPEPTAAPEPAPAPELTQVLGPRQAVEPTQAAEPASVPESASEASPPGLTREPAPAHAATPTRRTERAEQTRLSGWVIASGRWLRSYLTDEWSVAILAAILSISCYVWYDRHGMTLDFNDARIREMIARRVLVSRTPGLAQFGTTWLPLSFMVMLPLIWNDTLFRDGIAGSLPSMIAFVISAVYMYRLARQVTSSRTAGWVAAGVLMTNGNLLYIQATAMSETAALCAFIVAVYYAVRLTETHYALDLVKCAAATVAGTMIRYENWVFAIALVPAIAYIAWRCRQGYMLVEAWTLLYGLLAFAGCAAWVLYNDVIFHDPLLSFFYGNANNTFATNPALHPALHHPVYAISLYSMTVGYTMGWAVVVMAVAGLIFFVWRQGLRHHSLPVYIMLMPLPFFWLVLYLGINIETLPQMGGQYYNVRFGLLMIPATAMFVAFLTVLGRALVRHLLACAVVAVVVVSSVIGILQTPLVLREALYGPAGASSARGGLVDADWFSSRYHGGNVLITYVNSPAMMFYLLTKDGFPDDSFITDANGPQFKEALAAPEKWVTWIVMDSDASNGASEIWTTLHRNMQWQRYFILRKTFGTTQIYERRSYLVGALS